MRFVLVLLMFLIWPVVGTTADSETDQDTMVFMMDAIRAQDWTRANRAAAQIGPLARDIVEWHRLRRGGEGSFAEYRSFLARNPDWPGLDLLRARGESALPVGGDADATLAWFGNDVPETGSGVLRLIEAYSAKNLDGDAQLLAVLAWRTLTLTADSEAELLDRFAPILAPHHTARLDDLLWRNQRSAAARMMQRVPEAWQKLAAARQALRSRAGGVDTLIEAVPEALQSDPGLAYERFNWRVAKNRNDDATALLAERSVSPEALGRPEAWANWRRIYTRRSLRAGDIAQAYQLASNHFLLDGAHYADLEWLSGFIALRFLDDPELALLHFDNFRGAVATPISLGRAGYWQGRAYEALGDPASAAAAYAFGADHQSSFYGLLSAEALGLPIDPQLAGTETFPPVDTAPFRDSSVLAAGLLLHRAGEFGLAERFLTHLVEDKPRAAAGQLAQIALTLNDPHLALRIAKRAAQGGVILPAAYFPLHPMAQTELPVPTELALSIARRESEFDAAVVSPAGALGLMQVMPGTARDVAAELQIDYARARLTTDPAYNITLGTQYLAGLTEIFGSAPVLIAVGYNAGPGRAVSWVGDFGDPRSAGVDIIDWIEMIPFRETRNYVMRVTESVAVYRARLGKASGPLAFTKYLRTGAF